MIYVSTLSDCTPKSLLVEFHHFLGRPTRPRMNHTVAPDDVVLHLGDIALGSIQRSLLFTTALNGRRFLVPGNHDRVSTATQSRTAIERFARLYEDAGWRILPEVIQGSRRGQMLLASHYPYRGDSQEVDRHVLHRPLDQGIPLIHGHTHARDRGADGNQFHIGVDAFEYAPLPFSLIDAWLLLRRGAVTGSKEGRAYPAPSADLPRFTQQRSWTSHLQRRPGRASGDPFGSMQPRAPRPQPRRRQ